VEAIARHGDYLRASGEWQWRDRQRLQAELVEQIQAALVSRWRDQIPDQIYRSVFVDLMERQISPQQAVQLLLDRIPAPEDPG